MSTPVLTTTIVATETARLTMPILVGYVITWRIQYIDFVTIQYIERSDTYLLCFPTFYSNFEARHTFYNDIIDVNDAASSTRNWSSKLDPGVQLVSAKKKKKTLLPVAPEALL